MDGQPDIIMPPASQSGLAVGRIKCSKVDGEI